MTTFQKKRAQVSEARDRLRAAEERLHNIRNLAAARQAELNAALRLGTAEAKRAVALKAEIEGLKKRLVEEGKLFANAKAGLAREIAGFVELDDLTKQIEEWADHTPILLLPVRVETRFMQVDAGTELWVRIFPDDVAIHTHESELTLEEIEDGRAYWSEMIAAAGELDDDIRQEKEKGAWRALTGDHGGSRASWVAVQTRSELTQAEADAGTAYWAELAAAEGETDADVREQRMQAAWMVLSKTYGLTRARWIASCTAPAPDPSEAAAGETFWQNIAAIAPDADPAARMLAETDAWRTLQETYGDFRSARIVLETKPATWTQDETDALVFRLLGHETAAPESWCRAPRSNVMPDRFAVLLQSGDETKTHFGAGVPDPIVVGPDPNAESSDLQRIDGDIVPGEDIAWMYDFDRAVDMGLGLKIPLDAPFDVEGFDRLLVVGLRVSADANESRKLIEELLENHHHAPDGAGLIPQGTPTSNTEDSGSGFLSRDLDPEQSMAVETGPPLFQPTATPSEKRDGQWLAEALGIDFRPLEHLEYSDGADAAEARAMNQALWPATLGYYLEQMLGADADTVRKVESYFVQYVSGRGPLPALRIGEQPYGLLVTSSFPDWKFESRDVPEADAKVVPINERIYELLALLAHIWRARLSEVSYVSKPGDAYQHLLDMLGLHATSVDFHRRHAVGSEFLYNYARLVGDDWVAENTWRLHRAFAREVLAELGWTGKQPPPILDLTYFGNQDHIVDPLVDDVENADDETFSEKQTVRAVYKIEDVEDTQNYISWLRQSDLPDIRKQKFKNAAGDSVTPPRPLLYRMLRHGLLLANADTALRLYVDNGLLTAAARKQVELVNVREQRTITQWEYLDARMDRVLPEVSDERIAMHTFINSEVGLALPQASGLSRVRSALALLQDLPTARLERLFAEHVDLCSYRLDAWQTALFTERLWNLRYPDGTQDPAKRVMGLHLGSFCWLEDVRPALEPPKEVDPGTVPPDLLEAEAGPLTEQPENGGFIHGPSLNHAVTGAVLRNAYLTHADPDKQELMAVDLSSERVRLANKLLEGIRARQPLGALLGYQFERGLQERYGDPSLAAYFPAFRNEYPLVTDLITPDDEGEDTELKEARNVFDGYRLLEVTLLAETPLAYPYNVAGLPPAGSPQAIAIQAEVERMAWALDAVKDLALAEGVYQVTQGNYDRAGAMLKAIAQGTHPPEPEIVQTPRSGAAVNHRVAVHFDPAAPNHVWTVNATVRSAAEPALNAWLGDALGDPAQIRYIVQYTTPAADPAAEPTVTIDPENSLANLTIEPIDLIHIIGEELADGDSELLRRIRNAYREAHSALTANQLDSLRVEFPPSHERWTAAGHKSLFSVMPLIIALKQLVSGARPLAADDYVLPSEGTADLDTESNPKGYDAPEYKTRLDSAYDALSEAVTALNPLLDTARDTNLDVVTEATQDARFTALRNAVSAFAPFGFPDAFLELTPIPPHGAEGEDPFRLAWNQLLDLAGSIKRQADLRLAEADRLKEFRDLTAEQITDLTVTQKVDRYREAARQVLGSDFNLLPRFAARNPDELLSAQAFRDLPSNQGLIRHSANPLIAEEWLQGAARVRDRLELLETIVTLSDAFGTLLASIKPLQLPFRETDYWIAVEYPDVPIGDFDSEEVFRPVGDFLSIAQQLPAAGFDPNVAQTGLMIDAWTEVIPNRQETTGIAVNYNQPNAEPPQALLLAVPPELTGNWKWDDLIAVLEDTLERAKLRAVEPDHLGDTGLGHFLPAVLTPTTSNPDAAIATPLDYLTAFNYIAVSPPEG